jgi:Family of unknown function (DUF6263)
MRLPNVLAWMALVLLSTGCNQSASTDDEAALDVPEWLSNDSATSRSDQYKNTAADSPTEELASGQAAPGNRPTREAREPRGELKLQLQMGEQFPLKKQVVTTLVQTASDGTVQEIQTELRLLMAIQVEEVANGRTRLGVKYNRVEFEQTMDGQKLAYRSANPPAQIPVAAQAYHDMVNDGFSFWIGKDQINEVVGFREFLERCLANVPASQQKQVMLGMEAGSDENGISDFVDNTIGLLPFGQDVTPGQEWTRHRSVTRPIPMIVQCKYTLQELTDAEAVVKITGDIIPSQTINKVNHVQSDDINVTVLGGSTVGQCVIFRETGLPKESYTERVVNMTVDLGDGFAFEQTKTVQTRVEAFPPVRTGP